MAARTLRSVSGVTRRVPLTTRDTDITPTPATFATSASVGMQFSSEIGPTERPRTYTIPHRPKSNGLRFLVRTPAYGGLRIGRGDQYCRAVRFLPPALRPAVHTRTATLWELHWIDAVFVTPPRLKLDQSRVQRTLSPRLR